MRLVLCIVFYLIASLQSHAQQADDRVMMILDGSNSMWGRVDGEPKISIAKEVMTDLISNWDDKVKLGLMVYGHRRKNDCSDIEVFSMPGAVNRLDLISKVQSISPRGKTPISKSLQAGAGFVGLLEKNASIVLVSDGLETCEADPCATARTLEILNPGLEVHVVAFDVTEEEFKSLQCIATETGGKFFRASNARELKAALRQTVQAEPASEPVAAPEPALAPAPVPLAEPKPSFFLYAKLCETCDRLPPLETLWTAQKDGDAFYEGLGVLFAKDPVFEPGTYSVRARYASSALVRAAEVTVGEDGQQVGEVNLNGGGLSLYAYASDDKTLPASPMLYQFYPVNDGVASGTALDVAVQGGSVTWLPAGIYKVVAQHQALTETVKIEVVAGKTVKHEFDMRFGNLRPGAALIDGGAPISNMTYRIYGSKQAAIDGGNSGDGIAFGLTNANLALKAGNYWVFANHSPSVHSSVQRIFPVTVKTNETSNPVLTMNAGIIDFDITSAGEDVGVFFSVLILQVNPDGSDGARAGASASRAGMAALTPGRYRFLRQIRKTRVVTDDFEIVAGQITVFKATIR